MILRDINSRDIKLKIFILAISMGIAGSAFADNSDLKIWKQNMKVWAKNYSQMISLIQSTDEVGNCGLSLSTEPNLASGAWIVNFITNPGGISNFVVTPPKATNGRSQVIEDKAAHTLAYRESDMVGWTNMILTLSNNKKIESIKLTKTLPNGEVYDQGIECKTAP